MSNKCTGSRLLTAGDSLDIWQDSVAGGDEAKDDIEFYLEDKDRPPSAADRPPSATDRPPSATDGGGATEPVEWTNMWHCKTATPVTMAKFSSDGMLFATAGKVGIDSLSVHEIMLI